ncbi:hypothetical protein ACFWIB_14890 [Streptomyces sp. NPDC127051]|uniref:hypothetical protein n=1 Tax=Streptomyces sp. NPDC127051 TaxID=3347119 RepID=UPI00365624FF
MTAGRICCVCDQPIIGDANTITRHSASGARPDDYSHKVGDPACVPRRSVSAMADWYARRRT